MTTHWQTGPGRRNGTGIDGADRRRRFGGRSRGASATGYGLIVGLIAVIVLVAVGGVGGAVADLLGATARHMTAPGGGDAAQDGAPSGQSQTLTTEEDADLALSAADFGFSDPDSGDSLEAVILAGFSDMLGGSTLELAGTPIQSSLPRTLTPAEADQLVYSPAPDGNGPAASTLDFRVSDGEKQSSISSLTFAVQPVNDPPSFALASNMIEVEAGAPHSEPDFAIGFDPGPGEGSQQITGYNVTEANPGGGAVSGVTIDSAGTLSFTANSAGSEQVDVTVTDDGGTADGGLDTSSPALSFTIEVTEPHALPAVGTLCPDPPQGGPQGPVPGDLGCTAPDGAFFAGTYDNGEFGFMLAGKKMYIHPGDVTTPPDDLRIWGPFNTENFDARSPEFGADNTQALVDAADAHPAAQACHDLGGDWYLPAEDELNMLWTNLVDTDNSGVGTAVTAAEQADAEDAFGFDFTVAFGQGIYWSSTEEASNSAWMQRFSNGNASSNSKAGGINECAVRCVRQEDP